MEANPFLDKARAPTRTELTDALGKSAARWSKLETALASDFEPLETAWTYSGKAYGWSQKLVHRKRTVVYLLPRVGGFLAAFALGEKACAAARASDLPAPLLELIEAAPKYAEGRGVRFPVRTQRDIANVRSLAAIKLAH